MQNKLLRASLLITIIFFTLREVWLLSSGALRGVMESVTDMDPYVWWRTFSVVQDSLFGVMQLALLVAGIALVASAAKSRPALISGILICGYSLLVNVRMVLYYVLNARENYELYQLMYPSWLTWVLMAVVAVAFILLGVHYKSKALIWLTVVMTVVRMVMQMLVIAFNHEWLSFQWYTLVMGIVAFVVFALQLALFIVWMCKTKK